MGHEMDNKNVNMSSFSNETQTDFVVRNMWGKMKALESKYIDLANFYKQELLSSRHDGSQTSKSAVGGVV
jgi:hypothetical protein